MNNAMPAIITAVAVCIAFLVIYKVEQTRSSSADAYAGMEFKVEGFSKVKILGISNARAMTIMTDMKGHTSFHEMSLNTVRMFQDMEAAK